MVVVEVFCLPAAPMPHSEASGDTNHTGKTLLASPQLIMGPSGMIMVSLGVRTQWYHKCDIDLQLAKHEIAIP